MAIGSTTTAQHQILAEQIAREYIRAGKRWPDEEYSLEFLRCEGTADSPILILDAVHRDDLSARGRGPSASVQLHVDLRGRRVVRELGYQ
jgi:hypothetical protein